MRSLIATLLLAGLLTGCQVLTTYPRALRPLAPPIDEHHHVQQLLTLRWGEQMRRFRCTVTIQPGITRINAVDADGALVFGLRQTPGNINIERSPRLPPQVSPDVLLADMQLILWPPDTLEKSLPAGLHLENHVGYRELYNGTTLEARVNYYGNGRWNDPATLVNHRYGYRLTVQPLTQDDTAERP